MTISPYAVFFPNGHAPVFCFWLRSWSFPGFFNQSFLFISSICTDFLFFIVLNLLHSHFYIFFQFEYIVVENCCVTNEIVYTRLYIRGPVRVLLNLNLLVLSVVANVVFFVVLVVVVFVFLYLIFVIFKYIFLAQVLLFVGILVKFVVRIFNVTIFYIVDKVYCLRLADLHLLKLWVLLPWVLSLSFRIVFLTS